MHGFGRGAASVNSPVQAARRSAGPARPGLLAKHARRAAEPSRGRRRLVARPGLPGRAGTDPPGGRRSGPQLQVTGKEKSRGRPTGRRATGLRTGRQDVVESIALQRMVPCKQLGEWRRRLRPCTPGAARWVRLGMGPDLPPDCERAHWGGAHCRWQGRRGWAGRRAAAGRPSPGRRPPHAGCGGSRAQGTMQALGLAETTQVQGECEEQMVGGPNAWHPGRACGAGRRAFVGLGRGRRAGTSETIVPKTGTTLSAPAGCPPRAGLCPQAARRVPPRRISCQC